MEITIGYNSSTTGELQFHMVSVKSNTDFGNPALNISSVYEIISNNEVVTSFFTQYPDKELQIFEIFHYDSQYNSGIQGYYFESTFTAGGSFDAIYSESKLDYYSQYSDLPEDQNTITPREV